MASIEILILILVASSIVSYFLTKINTFTGSILTIFSTMFVFVSLAYYGFNDALITTVSILPGFSFEFTYLGAYFAIIVAFVYSMASFFHPYFVDNYKFKNVYNMLFLLSFAGILGAFFTNSFLQLFFFFELIVWTSMFLIPLGKGKSATVSYFGFSAAGSFAMLFGIFIMFREVGSFNISAGLASLSGTNAIIVFISFIIAGFAKLGLFPLHIWLPKAYTKAPHAFTPVLSGGLSKLGAFVAVLALIRISPASSLLTAFNLPYAHYFIAILGAISIVIGTLMAIREDDAKKLLAYSSMSHGGYIIVAFSLLDSVAFAGGFYHILAHALASAGAFLAIAAVARQTGTTKMSEMGGIIHKMPITYIVYLVAIISMAGIPPMGGFISKWLIFQAVLDKGLIFITIAVFFGSIGSFLYVFRPLAALFLGQEFPQFKKIKEAPILMLIPMIIITLLNIYTGVLPNGILGFINKINIELGVAPILLDSPTFTITGYNGVLHPLLIAGIFGFGVVIAFIIFILLKKSRQVGLMDTYTAANFIHTEELLHYSVDFYAPLERLYEKYTTKMTDFYDSLANKVKELGTLAKYLFMSKYVEVAVFWIVAILAFLLWGEL